MLRVDRSSVDQLASACRRQFEKRAGRADRERLEIFARGFHGRPWMLGFGRAIGRFRRRRNWTLE